ncbi:MAG TPA: acylphosphatase [Chloroflexota bacterium]|nr:acylphosphatase [Chloroflexota bacterium]
MERAHLRIHGRVQGVFFRQSAAEHARSLGLTGWVRNVPDGTVEAVVQGERDAVQSFLRWARRGPSGARVEQVEIGWEAPGQELDSFRITG